MKEEQKIFFELTPLRFMPHCAFLLSVVGAYNRGYTVQPSARASPKFFFHFVPEKLRIRKTLCDIYLIIVSYKPNFSTRFYMKIEHRELHRVVLTAIVHKENKYLIVQRSKNKKAFPGKWTVPGGGLEVDDYINLPKTTPVNWYFVIENSLRREIKEEVGIEVERPNYLLDLVFIRKDGISVVILSYYCKYKSGEIKLNEENTASEWVTAEEAKGYDLISGLSEEIEMVDRILKGEDPDKVKSTTEIK